MSWLLLGEIIERKLTKKRWGCNMADNVLEKTDYISESSYPLSELILERLRSKSREKEISQYINEDPEKVEASVSALLPRLIKSFYKKCLSSKTALSDMISEIRRYESDKESYKDSKIVLLRELDFRTDQGYLTLDAVFKKDLNSEFISLSSFSELKDESDFTLISILTTYILENIPHYFKDSHYSAYDLLTCLKDISTPLHAKTSSELFAAPPVFLDEQSETETKEQTSWLLPFLLLGALLLLGFLMLFSLTPGINSKQENIAVSEHSKLSLTERFNIRVKKPVLSFLSGLNSKLESGLPSPDIQASLENKPLHLEALSTTGSENNPTLNPGGTNPDGKTTKTNDKKETPSLVTESPKISSEPKTESGENIKSGEVVLGKDQKKILSDLRLDEDISLTESRLISFSLNDNLQELTLPVDSLRFGFKATELNENDMKLLSGLSLILKTLNPKLIQVVGHTDATGQEWANIKISLERANTVRDEFISNGIPSGSLVVKGMGSSEPLESNDTPEGRYKNRRVELRIKK